MEMKKLDFAETLKDSIEIGVKNAPDRRGSDPVAGNYLDTLPKHRDDYRLHHLRRDVRTLRAGRFDRNGHRSLVLKQLKDNVE